MREDRLAGGPPAEHCHGGATDLLPCGCDPDELAARMGVPKAVIVGSTLPTEGPWPNVTRDGRAAGEAARHFGGLFGPLVGVLHDPGSWLVHVDIHVHGPMAGHPYLDHLTTGMSQRSMKRPERVHGLEAHAELTMRLPLAWAERELRTPERFPMWTIGWLRDLARMPHEHERLLAAGHVVDFDDALEPGCPFAGAVIANAGWPGPAHAPLRRSDGARVRLLQVVPVYRSELEFADGGDGRPLLGRLAARGVDAAVDIEREPVA